MKPRCDFGFRFSCAFSNRVAMVDTAMFNRQATDASAFPTATSCVGGPQNWFENGSGFLREWFGEVGERFRPIFGLFAGK